MSKRKSVFIGGGFVESQYIWSLPIICNFCKKKKIEKIIFEEKISLKIFKNKKIKNLLKNFEIEFYNKNKKLNFLKYLIKIKVLSIYLIEIIKLIFFFDKKIKKNKSEWLTNQIEHSYWDTALSLMEDNRVNPSFFQKLLSAFLVMETKHNAKKILKNYNVVYSFLGHSVYKYRTLLAIFRSNNVINYCQANYSFYKQEKYYDTSWNILKRDKYIKLLKKINKNKVEKYWNKRLKGKSNYEDANVAANVSTKNKNYPKNVILLHIFKDSPFNFIDNERIFYDYFQWINNTLSILKNSKETWAIRLHPNAKRWGENQFTVISKLIGDIPKNIILDDNLISNNNMFQNCRRVVTYSGTSHLESSAFGIKPIIISDVTLSKIKKNYVLKPRNLHEYKKLLLMNNENSIFIQRKNISYMSKKLIFIRENLLSLKKILKGKSIYRGDSIKIFKKEYKLINKGVDQNFTILKKIGIKFSNGYTHII